MAFGPLDSVWFSRYGNLVDTLETFIQNDRRCSHGKSGLVLP